MTPEPSQQPALRFASHKFNRMYHRHIFLTVVLDMLYLPRNLYEICPIQGACSGQNRFARRLYTAYSIY